MRAAASLCESASSPSCRQTYSTSKTKKRGLLTRKKSKTNALNDPLLNVYGVTLLTLRNTINYSHLTQPHCIYQLTPCFVLWSTIRYVGFARHPCRMYVER